jgi:hypothetical protein
VNRVVPTVCPRARATIRRAVVVALLLLATFLETHAALAQAIAEVTLTAAGPDQELPLRASFYLKGQAAPSVNSVVPIFVRYSQPVWGISPSYGCREVASALSTRVLDTNVFDGKVAPKTVGALWSKASPVLPKFQGKPSFDSLKGQAIFVPAPWKRAADEKEFKVLVGGKDFFAAGSYYCMFVYQRTQADANRAADVRVQLVNYAAAIEKCSNAANAQTTAAGCGAGEQAKTITAIQGLVPKLDAAWIKQSLLPAGRDAAAARTDIQALASLANSWVKPAIPLPGDLGISNYSPVSDPLVQVIVRLLARDGRLYPKLDSGTVVFYDDAGKFEIKHVGILDNWSGVLLREDLQKLVAGKQLAIKVDLTTLVVPDTKITLLDLLYLARGKLRIGTTLVRLDSLFSDLIEPAMKGTGDAARLLAIAAGLDEWAQAFDKSSNSIHGSLQAWLQAAVLQSCNGGTFAAKLASAKFVRPAPPAGDPVKCAPGAPPTRLGFDVGRNPFEALASRVADYARPLAVLADLDTKAVDRNLSTTSYSETPLRVKVDMSQKTFVTSYLTLVAGSARYLSEERAFSSLYTGVQIYFFPNPIDEPMWTNGVADIRRLVSVELGVVPKTQKFGPDGRYEAPPHLPLPFFAGVAIQPIPYGTLSFGRYWAGRRTTALAQEAPQWVDGFYLGASVQANIPDLIRALASGGVNSSAK